MAHGSHTLCVDGEPIASDGGTAFGDSLQSAPVLDIIHREVYPLPQEFIAETHSSSHSKHEVANPSTLTDEENVPTMMTGVSTEIRGRLENTANIVEESQANPHATPSERRVTKVASWRRAVNQSLGHHEGPFEGKRETMHISEETAHHQLYRQQQTCSSQNDTNLGDIQSLIPHVAGVVTSQYVSPSSSGSTSPKLSHGGLGALAPSTPLASDCTVSCYRAGSQVSVVLSPLSRPLSLAHESPLSTRVSLRESSTRSSVQLQHASRASNSPTTYQQLFPLSQNRDETRELAASNVTWNSSGVVDVGKEYTTSSAHSVDSSVHLQRQRSFLAHARVGSSECDVFPHPSESANSDIQGEKGYEHPLKNNSTFPNNPSPRNTTPTKDAVKTHAVPPVQIMHRPPTVPNRALEWNYESVASSSGRESNEDYNDFVDERANDYGNQSQLHYSMQHRQRLFAPLMSRWRTSRRCTLRGSYKRSKRQPGNNSRTRDDWNLAERLQQLEQIRATNYEALEERKQHQLHQQSAVAGTEESHTQKCTPGEEPYVGGGSDSTVSDGCGNGIYADIKPKAGKSKSLLSISGRNCINILHGGSDTGRSARSLSTPSSGCTLDSAAARELSKTAAGDNRRTTEPSEQLNDLDECSIVSCSDFLNRGSSERVGSCGDVCTGENKMLLPILGLSEPEDPVSNGGEKRHRSWGSNKGARSAPHVLLKRTPRSTTLPYHRATSVVASLLQQLMLHDSGKISMNLAQSHSTIVPGDSKELGSPVKCDEEPKRGRRRQIVRWKRRAKNIPAASRKLSGGNGVCPSGGSCSKPAGRGQVSTSNTLEAPTTTIVSSGATVTYAATPHVEKSTEKHVPRSTPVHERGKDRRREGCHFSPSRGETGVKSLSAITVAPVGQTTKGGIRLPLRVVCNGSSAAVLPATPMTARAVCGRRYRATTCSSLFQSPSSTMGSSAAANKRPTGCFQMSRFRNATTTGTAITPSTSGSGGGGTTFSQFQPAGMGPRICSKSVQFSTFSYPEQQQVPNRVGPHEVSPIRVRGAPGT